jgi:hypothetical protein
MESPRTKEKRGLCRTALYTIKLRLEYRTAALLRRILSTPFWWAALKRARLADELERRRT